MGPPETTVWEFPGGDDSWALETSAFVDDVRLGREPSPGLREGIRALEIVEVIYRKAKAGKREGLKSGTLGNREGGKLGKISGV
jgi:predicted dehydrogenase